MKRKLSLAAVLAALVVTLSMVFTACGNTATDTAAPAESAAEAVTDEVAEAATDAAEAATEAEKEAADAVASDDEAKEVSFKLEIEPGDAGDAESLDCNAAGTLGDYLRALDGCDWEESQYGIFVTGFNGISNDDAAGSYWMLYVDGESSIVGADEVNLEEGATYTWKYETFE